MPRGGINSELYKTISSPPDWAMEPDETGQSAYFLTKHLAAIESFLSATTDSVRLVRASKVSREILEQDDMAELEDLRATIQASELLRVIPYPQQTDHSAHTLYLYLLGIYLFFACTELRKGIATFLKEKDNSPRLLERFLFHWVFISLLHDIGYIFQGRSRSEIRAVDRMFRASTIKRLMDSDDGDVKQRVSELVTGKQINPFEPVQNPEDMLTLLRNLPWGVDAEFDNDIFELFDVYASQGQKITGNDLEDYAYRVASSGYDGFSEGMVDHAIASGLFLFRYSTFWFWLAKKCRFKKPFDVFRDGYPKFDVICACFATAAHNLIGIHAKDINPVDFSSNPFIYLGILCDELQKWDRFPAGERHIVDLQSFEKHCTDSERITITGTWGGEKVIIRFEEEELAVRVKKALERLDSTEIFVKINPDQDKDDINPAEDKDAEVAQHQDSSGPA